MSDNKLLGPISNLDGSDSLSAGQLPKAEKIKKNKVKPASRRRQTGGQRAQIPSGEISDDSDGEDSGSKQLDQSDSQKGESFADAPKHPSFAKDPK